MPDIDILHSKTKNTAQTQNYNVKALIWKKCPCHAKIFRKLGRGNISTPHISITVRDGACGYLSSFVKDRYIEKHSDMTRKRCRALKYKKKNILYFGALYSFHYGLSWNVVMGPVEV